MSGHITIFIWLFLFFFLISLFSGLDLDPDPQQSMVPSQHDKKNRWQIHPLWSEAHLVKYCTNTLKPMVKVTL